MEAHKRTDFGTLGREAERKLSNDNDIKIIVLGANSQTGVGKTTLAIQICRFIDPDWNAEEKSFINVQEYLNAYLDFPGGSALLLDEIGAGADSRRAMSGDNVNLSHGWQMLRSRNIATVATLPSTNMLDSRMLELADYWVLVKKRGLAQPFEIRVNDFNGKISRKPLPGEEHIQFPDIKSNDPDKKYLDSIKDDKVSSGGLESIALPEHKKRLEKAEDAARKEVRDNMIRAIYTETDLSYADIGNLSAISLTKQTVGQIVRED